MADSMAVVAGATGAVSKRLIEMLLSDGNCRVVGLARGIPHQDEIGMSDPNLLYIAVDLTDAAGTRRALSQVPDVTHIYYAARADFSDASAGVEDVAFNVCMVVNLVNAGEEVGRKLRHVHLVEGTKWYGSHIGPMLTPAREDDPRHMPQNFYYAQEDALRLAQEGNSWTWSASRPNFLYDFAPERPRNLVPMIAVWAAMCKEMGVPLDFPGTRACYDALVEGTDARQLAAAIKWMVSSERVANQAVNITDGAVFRWSRLWPRIAEHYEMPLGTVRHMTLASWMADKECVWRVIVERYRLQPSPCGMSWTGGSPISSGAGATTLYQA